MFDFSWSELMVIGAVALVAIGPKDLPKALRTAGIMMRKARTLAREFHNSVDDMIREAELEEIRQSVQQATRFDLTPEPEHRIVRPPAAPAPAPEQSPLDRVIEPQLPLPEPERPTSPPEP